MEEGNGSINRMEEVEVPELPHHHNAINHKEFLLVLVGVAMYTPEF